MVNRLRSGLGAMGIAIGGTIAIARMRAFVVETIAIGDNFDKIAQQVGLTTRELQAFSHAAELGGVDGAAFANGMGQLQRKAYDASTGLKEAEESFEALGINVLDSNGELKSGSQLLRDVAVGLSNTSNSSTRTALSMELMGRSGRRLLPMLTGGAEALDEMAGELGELGGGASTQMIRQSVELTDTLTRFKVQLLSVRSAIAVRVLPLISRATIFFGKLALKWKKVIEKGNLLKAAAIALGAVLVGVAAATIGVWGPIVGTILGVAAAFGLVALIVDDLLTWIDGGQSVTQRFLETLFGIEEAEDMLQDTRDGFEDIKSAVEGLDLSLQTVGDTLHALWELIEPLINAFRILHRLQALSDPRRLLGGLGRRLGLVGEEIGNVEGMDTLQQDVGQMGGDVSERAQSIEGMDVFRRDLGQMGDDIGNWVDGFTGGEGVSGFIAETERQTRPQGSRDRAARGVERRELRRRAALPDITETMPHIFASEQSIPSYATAGATSQQSTTIDAPTNIDLTLNGTDIDREQVIGIAERVQRAAERRRNRELQALVPAGEGAE